MHPSAVKVAGVLRELGVTGDIRELPEPAPISQPSWAAAVANSLIFNADGAPLLVLTSGAHRVDTGRVAALIGADKVKRADPEFVRRSTGQVIGGVAPVGHPAPVRTLVDTELGSYAVVWAAAGHTHTVFATSYRELLRITGGTPATVAADP